MASHSLAHSVIVRGQSLAHKVFVSGQSLAPRVFVSGKSLACTQSVCQWKVTDVHRHCSSEPILAPTHRLFMSGKSFACTRTVCQWQVSHYLLHERLFVNGKCLPCTRYTVQSLKTMFTVVERPARLLSIVNWHTVLSRGRDFPILLSLFWLEVHSARRMF